jgi:hypothetical protein
MLEDRNVHQHCCENHISDMRFFLLRTLLEENLYKKAVQFKDNIHGKFQSVTKKINEVNSTVTKSSTVKCILITGWKQPMKISVLSTVV